MLSSLGVEHKGTAGIFATYFPQASIWIQPGQYSYPVKLPTSWFFPFGRKLNIISNETNSFPFSDEIDHAVLGPFFSKQGGGFSETAFFHRETKTLFVTDAVVKVDDDPPAIIQDDPRALLYHARDSMLDIVTDTRENRMKGWRRMVLFGLTFQPSGIEISNFADALKMVKLVPAEMKKLGIGAIPIDGGLYPVRLKWRRGGVALLWTYILEFTQLLFTS